MKKHLLILLFLMITVLVHAHDESTPMYKNAITFSPLKFTENTFQMGYERLFNESNSLYFALGAIYKEENDHEEGFLGEIHYRYRVYNNVNENSSFSIFFSPYLQYKYVEISRYNIYYENNIWDHTYNGIAPKLGFNVGFNF